jgi:hypothetical protein
MAEKPKAMTVLGKRHPYVGNPTPKMLEEVRDVLEKLATGETTVEKMAADFEASERRKIN